MKHKVKPWLNEDGATKSNSVLERISESWNQATWEESLATLETPQREHTVADVEAFGCIRLGQTEYKDLLETNDDPKLRSQVRRGLQKLTPLQREIIILSYWEGFSERDIAQKLNRSRSTVRTIRERALIYLQEELASYGIKKKNLIDEIRSNLPLIAV